LAHYAADQRQSRQNARSNDQESGPFDISTADTPAGQSPDVHGDRQDASAPAPLAERYSPLCFGFNETATIEHKYLISLNSKT
jgi:hypothetical protein